MLLWCRAGLQALIAAGRGDVPLIKLRFRCANCGGRRQGYAAFDVTTVVWLIVMVAILLVIIEPWPVRHAYW